MDALLAECVANPDDDGPRLVWADAVGGERGELVVVQCDLARAALSREAREARKRRERELLDRHAIEWAGELANRAERWSFRRGFVETATVPADPALDLPGLRAEAPLLGTLTLTGPHQGYVEPHHLDAMRGLLGVGLVGDRIGERFAEIAPVLATFGLRALALDGLDAQCLRPLFAMLDASPIETLQFRDLRLSAKDFDRLLRHVPQLTALAIETTQLMRDALHVAAKRPLRAFRIEQITAAELERLSDTRLAEAVERFGFGAFGMPLLPRLPKLVHCEPLEDELLHHDPRAMLTLGAARYRTAATFVLQRGSQITEFPEKPAFERISLGRVTGNTMVIPESTVSRRHAELYWNGTQHVVQDLASSSGIAVNDLRVDQHALSDGDILTIGTVRLRYFVGPDAGRRASR